MDPIPHPPSGNGEHPSQLAASKDPDGTSRQYRARRHGNVCSRTMSERPRRYACNLDRSSGRVVARI